MKLYKLVAYKFGTRNDFSVSSIEVVERPKSYKRTGPSAAGFWKTVYNKSALLDDRIGLSPKEAVDLELQRLTRIAEAQERAALWHRTRAEEIRDWRRSGSSVEEHDSDKVEAAGSKPAPTTEKESV